MAPPRHWRGSRPLGCCQWALLASLLVGSAAAAAPVAPCAERYAAWLTRPEAFLRRDQPANLQGLHVAGVWQEEDGSVQLEAYRDGVLVEQPLRKTLAKAAPSSSWKDFRKSLKSALKIKRKTNTWGYLHLKQPFGVFAEDGRRLSSAAEVLEAGLVLVIEGGQWFWPPVEVGYVRKLPGTGFELETLSVQPVLYRVRGFLHDNECEELVQMGSGRMFSSPVSLMDKDKGKAAKEFRTSTQARISKRESKKLVGIEKRVANLTRIPITHNEEVQILRYEKTQYYSAHLDNWDPAFYSSPETTAFMEHGHNNRQLTVFWYLTNVEAGGHTIFPRAHGLPQPMDMYSCEQGLKVTPEKGAVILWYSLHPNGNTDPNGLHGACPVEDGQKWSANYWVWNKPRDERLRLQMPDMELQEVAKEEEPGATQAVDATTQVTATFENLSQAPMYLFWLQPGTGQEIPLGTVAPDSAQVMNTFPGHVWHVRAGADVGSKLLERLEVARELKQTFSIVGKAGEL